MFLRPHHLQAAERFREDALHDEVRRIQPFFWGLTRMDAAADQLENFVFELRDVEAKLKDGSVISSGVNLRVSPRPFKAELEQAGGRMEVFLGVPFLWDDAPNTFFPGDDRHGQDRRLSSEIVDLPDENTGANPQPVETRMVNGRLFFGGESRNGYECLPVAIVERSGQGKNFPVLSKDFIPSVTEIGACPALQTLCESVTNRLEAKHRLVLTEVASGRLTIESEGTSGWQTLMKLKILGSFVYVLQQLTRIPRVHPFAVYCEFARLLGDLAIFDEGRRPLKVALYDHDRLGPCFFDLCHSIEVLAEKVVASRFIRVEFVPREDVLAADLMPEWFTPEAEFYVSVETELAEKELKEHLTTMKVGAVRDLPLLRQRRLFGLDLEMLKRVPTGLPAGDDHYYFAVEKEGIYWANVVKDHVMAVSGMLDPKLKFFLYVVTKPVSAARG
jgi:type VI secretion system protein ImpJ